MTKSSSVDCELKAAATETIYTRYPKNNLIHLYTDGSKMLDSVGVRVYSEIFALYAAFGPFRTNFDGELEAIKVATEKISFRTVQFQLKDMVIFQNPCQSSKSRHNVAESNIDSCRRTLQKNS
ncbi:hypothetical protein CEXT_302611 [Caerostris extrusa]|uniref:RNase H type-1 domain-containing protein n=1 Tax=Caerostris extrusa TaxID=172846 RepID=A0AAV4VFE4_CAEEX|nr:hypothetical protein CEXT_302611 [Caerostris extrusa]